MMSHNESFTTNMENQQPEGRITALASIIGAFLAASCCVVPLVLVTLGVSGAWIGSLSALGPYKPYFAAFTLGLLGLGFWQVYFKTKKDCEEGAYCATPASSRITKSVLWIATALVLLALSIDYWAPYFY